MIKKYTVYDQLTGSNVEASTFEEAVSIQTNLINTYMETIKDSFPIAVMVKNADGAWSHYIPKENGDPKMPEPLPITFLGEETL
jgi:hypothetical protein